MPSPFPGMDPYLESPAFWPDLHKSLACEISSVLNVTLLPHPYYAMLAVHREYEWWKLCEPERAEPHAHDDPHELCSVEVKDAKRGHEVVTAIEIVSPSNKHSGCDRESYLGHRLEVLESRASLVEIDLLRSGEWMPIEAEHVVEQPADLPQPDYLIAVNRSWQRDRYQTFPTRLCEPLPVIPVPLREGEDEITLDLQYVFRRAYDSGPYARGAVDYGKDPQPPLIEEQAAWARELIQNAFRQQREPHQPDDADKPTSADN